MLGVGVAETVKLIIAVALGGALGAVGRYLISAQVAQWFSSNIPWSTLLVNVLGSFILGALYQCGVLFWHPSDAVKAFLVVGILGGFTTFSTFSLDVVLLFERGHWGIGALYAVGSMLLAVLGLVVGLLFIRSIFT